MTSSQPDIRVKSFAPGFVGMLCATVIGFVWEARPLKPDSPEYGYDETFGVRTPSVSSANPPSNCSDDIPATAKASMGGSDKLRVRAFAATSPTVSFTSGE